MLILQVVGNKGRRGMETQVVDLCEALAGLGHRLVVACKKGGWVAEEVSGRLETLSYPMRRRFDFVSRRRFQADAERLRPDVIHAHGPVAWRVACRAAGKAGVPLVASVHGWQGISPDLALADRVLVVCRQLAERVGKAGVVESDISVVPNAVDTERYGPASGDTKTELRLQIGLPDGLLFASTCRLIPAKGHRTLIEAAARVVAGVGDVHFLIVGGGSPAYRKQLRDLCSRRKLGSAFVFMGQRADVPDILKAADALVHPSLEETASRAVIEAMASGLPVIAADVGGTRDLVRDGEDGLIVPAGSVEGFSEAITRLVTDAGLRTRMGHSARARAEREFSLSGVAPRVLDEYRMAQRRQVASE